VTGTRLAQDSSSANGVSRNLRQKLFTDTVPVSNTVAAQHDFISKPSRMLKVASRQTVAATPDGFKTAGAETKASGTRVADQFLLHICFIADEKRQNKRSKNLTLSSVSL